MARRPRSRARGDVVRQRVEPDVHDLLGVARNRKAPAARPYLRARDAEVVETAGDEGADLLMAPRGHHAQRAGIEELGQPPGVAREPEEVVLLLHDLRHDLVFGTGAVHQLVGRVEGLAADTVEAAVVSPVDIAGGVARPPEPLGAGQVARLGARPDEVVVADRRAWRSAPGRSRRDARPARGSARPRARRRGRW